MLETADGTVRIEGETVLSTHDITDPSEIPEEHAGQDGELDLPRASAGGRALPWDGEETFGMLERSSPMDKITG